MTTKNKLNLPIAILHEMDNVQYKISGTLVDINESKNTCTVEFRNGRVESGIPMSDVYISEGLLDTVKKYGKKLMSWIVKKVKGFVAFLNSDGEIDENSFNNAANLVVFNAKGYTPANWKLYPSANAVEQAQEMGISVNARSFDSFMDDADREVADIERYWNRVMNIAGTTDKTVEESIKYVNETYYHTSNLYNKMNEATIGSLYPAADGNGNRRSGGEVVNTAQLKNLIRNSIDDQLHLTDLREYEEIVKDEDYTEEEREDAQASINAIRLSFDNPGRPIIWGAPGVGKTAIIKSVLKEYKNDSDNPRNLNIYDLSMANKDTDSLRLPVMGTKQNASGDSTIEEALVAFLPFYTPRTGDDAYNLKCEEYYSKCMHLSESGVDSEGNDWQGGVLFLDELFRIDAHAVALVMNLLSGQIGTKKLASSWAVICASNRATDDPNDDHVAAAIAQFENGPVRDRFIPYTFVPTKEEWLEWATSVNSRGEQNVDPVITNFIASADESIWYRTIENGGYDDEIRDYLGKEPSSWLEGGFGQKQIEDLETAEDSGKNFTKGNTQSWNGRTWDRISESYRRQLKALLQLADPAFRYTKAVKMSKEEYDYVGIHKNVMKDAVETIPDEKFIAWVEKNNVAYPVDSKGNYQKLSVERKLDQIQNVLYQIVQIQTGGATTKVSGSAVSKVDNKATKEIKDYYKWQDIFNDDSVIRSIYTSGQMPKGSDYAKRDDLGVSRNGGFAWKDNTPIVNEVEQYIISKYPGNGINDFKKYVAFVGAGISACAGPLDTLGSKKVANAQAQIDKVIAGAFDTPKAFDAKKFKEYFTVHTGTDQHKDIEILPVDNINPLVANIMFNMIESCDFVSNCLNVAKYFIKVDFTTNCFERIGQYKAKNGEKELFKNMVMGSLGINKNQALSTEYTNVHNTIANIKSQNATKNATISSLQYLDVFYMLRACFTIAFGLKTKANMAGKAK